MHLRGGRPALSRPLTSLVPATLCKQARRSDVSALGDADPGRLTAEMGAALSFTAMRE